jgi:threonylcarbamoyladenosine tRNA methylthiotransferase MtaB
MLPFSDLHVFPFSSRPGTRAASIPRHVPAQIVTDRAARLRNIASLKKKIFLERFVGKELEILVQGCNEKSGNYKGLSRNYISASFLGKKSLVNEEVSLLISSCNGEVCAGELIAIAR